MMKYLLFHDSKKKEAKKNPDYAWEGSWIFSNFYTEKSPLIVDGETWTSTEHYYQAQKFKVKGKNIPNQARYNEYYNIIKSCDSPRKQKMLATQKKDTRFGKNWKINKNSDHRLVNDVIEQYKDLKLREDWEEAKVHVMIRAILHKFTQYKNLQTILLNNVGDDDLLVENSNRDKIWGDGGDRGSGEKGKNYLGKILTVTRHILKYDNLDHMSEELRSKVKLT